MIRIPIHRIPTHPGEMLLEEFLKPMGIVQRELTVRNTRPILDPPDELVAARLRQHLHPEHLMKNLFGLVYFREKLRTWQNSSILR